MSLRPTFPNSRPTFTSTVENNPNGTPHTITIAPLQRGGDDVTEDQVFSTIADAIRSRVLLALFPFRHLWTNSNIRRNVTGIIQMTNIGDSRHAHTDDLAIADLSTNTIADLFHRATGAGSNPNLSIYSVEFSYWVNPLSYQVGRGETLKKRAIGMHKTTMKTPQIEGRPIVNCAAASLTFLLAKQGHYGETFKINISQPREKKRWVDLSLELMNQCQWEEQVSMAEIKEFVKQYKEYRVVVVNTITRSSSTHDFKGTRYVSNGDTNILYLYYHPHDHHFSAISSISEFIKSRKGRDFKWCHVCCSYTNSQCECGTLQYRKTKQRNCEHCGLDYSCKIKHTCFVTKCKGCQMEFKNGSLLQHRCPIFMNLSKTTLPFKGETDEEHEKQYALWAYDIESALVFEDMDVPSYQTDENGHFYPDHRFRNIKRSTQVPNLVVWMNVFTKETHHSYSMDEFIQFMLLDNDGRNICIAHNAKGYDARLVFESIKNFQETIDVAPLMRGTQMIRIKAGNTIFQDSLLHLSGSLSQLADDFLKDSGIDLEKGEFPHFFNREDPQFRDYVGPLPSDEYYDLKYALKDDKAWAKHQRFRTKWQGRTDWNAAENLYEYCKNDVLILAELIYLHHKNCLDILHEYNPKLKQSPWNSTTSAGYIHKLFLTEQSLRIIQPKDSDHIKEVTQSSWAALEVNEHYFAKLALRGGRTEVRKFYHKAQEGETIKCVDVHSMYPSIQIGKEIQVGNTTIPLLFPVGTPKIEIHDHDYYPCNLHFQDPDKSCTCDLEKKMRYQGKKLEIVLYHHQVDLHQYIEEFDGILMVDVTPSQLYHPILPVFNETTQKCTFTCEPIVRKTFASPALKVAIRNGYVVTKIYRADRYKMAPSLWKGLLGNMYMMKFYSSSNGDKTLPGESVAQTHARQGAFYKDQFDIDIDYTKCEKRPSMKLTAKLIINSAWGKHAESVDHTQCRVIDNEGYMEAEEFLNRVEKRQVKVKEINKMGRRTLLRYDMLREWGGKVVRPDLHKSYLPCAVFVPMYGQLMTWNALNTVGERALMCDTDSVKYVAKPGLPDIQPSDSLGTWEDEGNLTEFVSIGLKSYCLRSASCPENIKLKGCCIKRSHKNLMNFTVMKELLDDNSATATLPQLSFDYTLGHGIRTREFLKTVKFDPSILKGNYNPQNYQLYPFGFVQ